MSSQPRTLTYHAKRSFVLLQKKSKALSALSCRLVQITGKSRWPIHPKHLVDVSKPWYLNHLKKNDVVLDIGCGNGQHTLRSAPFVASILGIDYDQTQLAVADAVARHRNVANARFEKTDLEQPLHLPSSHFDTVLFLDVLEHLHNRENSMSEIVRVLKPGGTLLLAIPNSETSWKKQQQSLNIPHYSDPDHKIEYTRQEIIDVCEHHHLTVRSIAPIVYDIWFVGFADLLGAFSLTLYKKIAAWKQRVAHVRPEDSIGFELVAIKLP